MSVVDAIIKANQEGRKVIWPGMAECMRCNIQVPEDELSWDDLCEICHDDMHTPWPSSAKAYIEAAQPVFPFKRKVS